MTVQRNAIPTFGTAQVVTTDEDYTLENEDAIVIALAPVPLTNLNFKLPPSPLSGQTVRLVSATTNIVVDGNGNAVPAFAQLITIDHAIEYTFACIDLCDPCAPGKWVPECCERESPPT